MSMTMDADQFIERLAAHRSSEQPKGEPGYFKTAQGEYGAGDAFMGVRMGQVFVLAKESIDMPLDEIEKLLESLVHEVHAGALSIMDKQARRKKNAARSTEGTV